MGDLLNIPIEILFPVPAYDVPDKGRFVLFSMAPYVLDEGMPIVTSYLLLSCSLVMHLGCNGSAILMKDGVLYGRGNC